MTSGLAGKSILLVEDEFLIADALCSLLEIEGASVLGPCATLPNAMKAIETGARADIALLDVNLRGEQTFPLVDLLAAKGTAVILTTGYDADTIPAAYSHLPRLMKPVHRQDLLLCIEGVLSDAM